MSIKRIYDGKGRIVLDGGLNNKFERSIILDNESPDCANVVFSNGAVATRPGTSKLNTTAVGSFAIDGLYTRHDSDQSQTMIAWAGGSAYGLATTTFTTIPSAQSVFTTAVRVCSTEYEDHIFFGNGGVDPYKYNGTDFTRHGVPAPTSTLTAATGAAGTLTGAYVYGVTYVNSQLAEGNISPVTSTLTVAGSQINLSNIPTAPQSFGVASRRIYRTVTSGTVYKRVTELANNTATTYTDNTSDSALGVTAPSDNGVPPKYSTIVYHQNRLFCNDPSNPNFIFYSELGEPYTWPSLNFRKVGDATGDIVRALSVHENALVVYCDRTVYLIYMQDTDPANWVEIKTRSAYGSKSPYGMFDFNNMQMFPAVQSGKFIGFAALSGQTVAPSSTLLTVTGTSADTLSERIEPDVFNFVESAIPNISSMVFKNKAWIAVTYGQGNSRNNRIYHFDFSYSDVSSDNKYSWVPFTGLSASQFTVYNGSLYFGSSLLNGFVYKVDDSIIADDGVAINSYFWTKEFSGYKQDVNNTKDFTDINMLVDKPGDYAMNLTYKVDSDSGNGTTTNVNLNPGGSLWGTMVWGTDVWGGGTAQENVKFKLGNTTGERIQFKFDNQNVAGQRFKVHWLNFTYNLKGIR